MILLHLFDDLSGGAAQRLEIFAQIATATGSPSEQYVASSAGWNVQGNDRFDALVFEFRAIPRQLRNQDRTAQIEIQQPAIFDYGRLRAHELTQVSRGGQQIIALVANGNRESCE